MTPPLGETVLNTDLSNKVLMSIAAFTAVAWYNVVELNIQVFITFRRHRGLYFWSLLISSYGCVLHALGFLLKFCRFADQETFLTVTIFTIGWYTMVTGQAVVLYSRLHLVVSNHRILRGVLIMIIVDAICLHIPTTILTYCENSSAFEKYTKAFYIMERLQMTAFCIQEFAISGVYVWATVKILRPVSTGRTRKILLQLIWINCIIVSMDLILLGMEYTNQYVIEATLKAMVYSIKLKLEFAVLNQLMSLANSSVNQASNFGMQDPETGSVGRRNKARSKSLWYQSSVDRTKNCVHRGQASGKPSFVDANRGRLKWVPSLNRNYTFKTEHVEVTEDPHNIFTNPAACFSKSEKNDEFGFPPHDGLGRIPSPASSLSPTRVGPPHRNTLRTNAEQNSKRMSKIDTGLPSGILRSTRPSVTDWADPDSRQDSPCSDQVALNPHERGRAVEGHHAPAPLVSPIYDETAAEKCVGLDFMTSALKEY